MPSKENVNSTPGLEHLAQFFPKKEDWPTILLIGRDCAVAQRQEHFTLTSNKQQIASKTPLGWVIMGSQSPSILKTQVHSHVQEGRKSYRDVVINHVSQTPARSLILQILRPRHRQRAYSRNLQKAPDR